MKNKKFIALGAGLAVVVCITGIMLHHSGQEEAVEVIAAVGEEDTGAGEQAEAAEPEKPAEDTPDTPEEEPVNNTAENGTEPAVETAIEEQEETEPDIEALDKTMYAQADVNIRKGPSVDYEKVGSLTINQEVKVTGQSKETGWYEIEVDGEKKYVSNKYLGDSRVTVTADTDSTANTDNASADTGNGNTANNEKAQAILDSLGATYSNPDDWVDNPIEWGSGDYSGGEGIHAE